MKATTHEIFEELFSRYPALWGCRDDIKKAFELLLESAQGNKKILVCGNGGSASDSEHIVGELMKSFKKARPVPEAFADELRARYSDGELLARTLEGTVRAISLTSHLSLSTAFANDNVPKLAFAQQLYGLGDAGDTLIAISTSGNSENCVYAAKVASVMGVRSIAMTGHKTSALSEICDCTIRVPECETFKIQELHLPVYHALCAMLEEELF